MSTQNSQAKILAQGIFQIRLLLSGYLGSQAEGDTSVREAAHLAYALHNEALAILDNKEFDEKIALSKIAAVDSMFNETYFLKQFSGLVANE
ncbi:MAG: hypothetical protein WC236_10835 [Gallionellaceae bacterium]|jgi:hypothetical protein